MSTSTTTQPDDQNDEQTVEERLDQLEAENQRLRERVNELEEAQDEHAHVEWNSQDPNQIRIVEADGRNRTKFFSFFSRDIKELKDRVRAVEEGEAEVVVRSETSHDTLPMEAMVAARQHGTGDLTVNQRRATLVFAAFGGEAESWSGKLRLDSHGVRRILSKKTNRDDWNSNTVKRIMKQTAKHTSPADDSEDRDPFDEDNLITLEKGDKRLELVADLEDWKDWYREATGDDQASVTVS